MTSALAGGGAGRRPGPSPTASRAGATRPEADSLRRTPGSGSLCSLFLRSCEPAVPGFDPVSRSLNCGEEREA